MFSVLSWNIQYGKGVDGQIDLKRIAEVIQQNGPNDVICLQEVSRNDPFTDAGNDQFAVLQDCFSEYEAYYGVAQDRSGGSSGGRRQFGNMILTRISPSRVMNHSLPSPADPAAKFMTRQCLEINIGTEKGDLRLMTTHLEYFSEKQQRAQIEALREIHQEACAQFREPGLDLPNTPFEFYRRPEKMIICGDFNFTPESISYQKMTADFSDQTQPIVDVSRFAGNGAEHKATCGIHDRKQWSEGSHCRDYFFVSENLEESIAQFKVDQETSASDHQPIRLIFEP